MSRARISSALAVWPRLYGRACTNEDGAKAQKINTAATIDDLSTRHLPVGAHVPNLDAIVMVSCVHSSNSDELLSRRLNVTRLIGTARLKCRRLSAPNPRDA